MNPHNPFNDRETPGRSDEVRFRVSEVLRGLEVLRLWLMNGQHLATPR
jgi:hypothetical protein